MTDNDILHQLQRVYASGNLNLLSSALIEAYRQKDETFFQTLAQALDEPAHQKQSQFFTALIMMVHPDRQTYHTDQINKLSHAGETGLYNRYSRILKLDKIIKELRELKSCGLRPADIEPGSGSAAGRKSRSGQIYDFLSALKQKEYGNLDIEYHPHDLENTEGDLELSGYGISDLSGLEFCIHLTGLDLSDNLIDDIQALSSLVLLEEINLSGNRISGLDALAGMNGLKQLDISFNEVEDLSPLLELNRLETINCIGNPVSTVHLQLLRKRGVIVIAS